MGRRCRAPRSGMTWPRSAERSACGDIFPRPGRMVLTVLGVVIGIVRAGGDGRPDPHRRKPDHQPFDQLAATELFVSAQARRHDGHRRCQGASMGCAGPADAAERRGCRGQCQRRRCWQRAGEFLACERPAEPERLAGSRSVPARRTCSAPSRAVLETGRLPDAGHSERADRVAVLGPDAALRLGIHDVDGCRRSPSATRSTW